MHGLLRQANTKHTPSWTYPQQRPKRRQGEQKRAGLSWLLRRRGWWPRRRTWRTDQGTSSPERPGSRLQHLNKIIARHIVSLKSHWLCYTKLMKGKVLRKHSLHEKTAASVLLKLFISGNEWCHTTDAP